MTIQINPEHVGDVAWRIRFKSADGYCMTFFVMVNSRGMITHAPSLFRDYLKTRFDEMKSELVATDPHATFTNVTAFVDGLESTGV